MSKRKGLSVAVYLPDGKEWPAWGLRAGQLITATDYDHDKRVLKVWVQDERHEEQMLRAFLAEPKE